MTEHKADTTVGPVDLSVDAESIGLHGTIFWIGAAVFNRESGQKLDTFDGSFDCKKELEAAPEDTQKWLKENVLAVLTKKHEYSSDVSLKNAFWYWYRSWCTKSDNKIRVLADCGNSIEARLFSECVNLDRKERNWQAPYPLHEIGTLRMAAGFDPTGTFSRDNEDEKPVHHPVADACQSYRLWREAEWVLQDAMKKRREVLLAGSATAAASEPKRKIPRVGAERMR
jgi:hypothetical protein